MMNLTKRCGKITRINNRNVINRNPFLNCLYLRVIITEILCRLIAEINPTNLGFRFTSSGKPHSHSRYKMQSIKICKVFGEPASSFSMGTRCYFSSPLAASYHKPNKPQSSPLPFSFKPPTVIKSVYNGNRLSTRFHEFSN